MFDQVTLFMVFLMLCFAGLAAMVYFVLRSLDELARELKGERSQVVGLLQSIESSMDVLVKYSHVAMQRQSLQNAKHEVVVQNVPNNPVSHHKNLDIPYDVSFSNTVPPLSPDVKVTSSMPETDPLPEEDLPNLSLKSAMGSRSNKHEGKGLSLVDEK